MLRRLCIASVLLWHAAAFAPPLARPAGRLHLTRLSPVMSAHSDLILPRMMPEPTPPPQPQPPGPAAPPRPNIPMPMVAMGDQQMDIYSRLAKDRILVVGTEVGDEMANNLVAQMLYLANEDPGKDITMYSESSEITDSCQIVYRAERTY
jgi:ATP-dependent Clp protease protease subunit